MSLWLPKTYTPSLTGDENFPSAGDKLLELVDKAWKAQDQRGKFELLPWQRWVIRHVLEVYPEGHEKAGTLRFRQSLISVGRQNGKSVLGSILGVFGLFMHEPGPEVVSVASTTDQANIIYKRVKHVIDENPSLLRRMARPPTKTRGMATKKGGSYKVYAKNAAGLQGVPVSLCLYDEVHITPPETWSAMLSGSKERQNGLVLGITTAGDDTSELLKHLYELGNRAANGDEELERFGFFLWEAPEGAPVDDEQALLAANPSLACGRGSVADLQSLVRTMPEEDARRYHLNQFVSSSSSWMPIGRWMKAAKGGVPEGKRPIIAIDRTPDWTYASITASVKVDGVIHTELVASLVNPNLEQLVRLCQELRNRHYPQLFVMDGYVLRELANELKTRGYPIRVLTLADQTNAAATAFALISQGKVSHAGDPLLTYQMPRAVRKNHGDSWKLSRRDSSIEIDAVMATVMGIYLAEITKEATIQVMSL